MTNHRGTKRQQIINYFLDIPEGQWVSSSKLHTLFGPSFRSRVSEINRDSSAPIIIYNETRLLQNAERSRYQAIRKLIPANLGQVSSVTITPQTSGHLAPYTFPHIP